MHWTRWNNSNNGRCGETFREGPYCCNEEGKLNGAMVPMSVAKLFSAIPVKVKVQLLAFDAAQSISDPKQFVAVFHPKISVANLRRLAHIYETCAHFSRNMRCFRNMLEQIKDFSPMDPIWLTLATTNWLVELACPDPTGN